MLSLDRPWPNSGVLTGEIRNQVDRIWAAFWYCGLSNPLEEIEQIIYLHFLKRFDDLYTQKENNRYKEVVHAEVAHRPPGEILASLAALETEVVYGMRELETMLENPSRRSSCKP